MMTENNFEKIIHRVMNVSYRRLSDRVENLLSRFPVRVLNNQLLTDEYIDDIMSEIKEKLFRDHKCKLLEVAMAHDMELSYLKNLVYDYFKSELKSGFHIDQDSSYFFSDLYFNRVSANVNYFTLKRYFGGFLIIETKTNQDI